MAETEHRKELSKLPKVCSSPIPPSSFDAFKSKYHTLYQDPHVTIPALFDGIMQDMGLPVRFKDVAKAVREGKGKVKIKSTLRMKILQRDGLTCRLCGRKAPDVKLHVDHIIPTSLGGLTEERNLQTLCFDCNMGKADKAFYVAM